jgi:hypothetical protein
LACFLTIQTTVAIIVLFVTRFTMVSSVNEEDHVTYIGRVTFTLRLNSSSITVVGALDI